jgi:hypothetical protein
MSRLPVRKEVLRDLAIRSKNKCAFPGCDQPLLTADGTYIAELCHIEAAEPGGQRYNPNQSDEDRRSFSNLLFLCHKHHKQTDDVAAFTAERLRDLKRSHEALPEVVFNAELLLRRLEEVASDQAEIRRLMSGPISNRPASSYSIIGPEVQDSWTPEAGRFYETKTGINTKFRYMMRDGWLHVEQFLEDGAVAYYEVNENGTVRNSRMPYPINEYRVVIPDELILMRERAPSQVGAYAVRTTLKWSKGVVTEHYSGNSLVGIDCSARSRFDHQARTITMV